MTQRSVEILIGKLVSDEGLRTGFLADPRRTVESFRLSGFDLNPLERQALQSLDPQALRMLADRLDPRLQKAALHADDGDA